MKPVRHSTRTAMHAATLALMIAASLPAQAVAEVDPASFASATVSLSNFRYQLIDLDSDDGITPGITFLPSNDFGISHQYAVASGIGGGSPRNGGGWPYQVGAAAGSEGLPGGQWFSAAPLNVQSLDGGATTASLDSGGAASSSRLLNSDIANYRSTNPSGIMTPAPDATWFLHASAYAGHGGASDRYGLEPAYAPVLDPATGEVIGSVPNGVDFKPDDFLNQTRFILTGNTVVLFEFDLSATVGIDLTKLENYDPLTTQASAQAYGSVQVFRELPVDGLTHWDSLEEAQAAILYKTAGVGAYVSHDGATPGQALQQTDQSTHSFGFNFFNAHAEDITARIGTHVESQVMASGLQTTVPEPATAALMGLGVLGMGLAARRRQRPVQA